jgi:hypothetical protein
MWRRCQGTEDVDAVQKLAGVVVADAQMVGVEASHYCSATGIGSILRLLVLATVNFSSRDSYRHWQRMTTTQNVGKHPQSGRGRWTWSC